jgi:hypothetical protein
MGEGNTWDYIQPIDVTNVSRAFRSAEGTPHLYIDDFLRPDFAAAVTAAYPNFEQAEQQGRSYSALHESGKVQITDASLFPDPVRRLNDALASDEFLETLVEITGIEDILADPVLQGGGMHLMRSGARLDVHVDFNMTKSEKLFRRLNLLLFLSPTWDAEWGGRFELWDPTVQNRLHAFEPRFNRCVCFATSETSFHGVEPVTCPPSELRRTFATYYYTREPNPDWSGAHHTTLFRHRPGETSRAILGVPQQIKRSFRAALRTVRQRLRAPTPSKDDQSNNT